MRILDLALKDLLQISRDWKTFLFLLAMPIAFTFVFGFAFGGFGNANQQTDLRLPIGIIDQDRPGGKYNSLMLELLNKSDVIRAELISGEIQLEEMEQWVTEGELAAVIIIPVGFSDNLLSDTHLPLETILNSDTYAGATAQNAIQSAVNRLVNAIGAAQFSVQVQERQQPFEGEAARKTAFDKALNQAIAAWEQPPFKIVSRQSGDNEKDPSTNAFTRSSPGMMVQFAIAGLIGAAEILVLERKSGSLKRLLTTATSRWDILFGHFLAMFLMIFMQIAILIIFAQVFLEVSYLRAPLATLLVAVCTALFTASMGLLIGTLAKNPEQAVVMSLIPMFILSGLGGAWVPLELTSQTFQTIGHFTPIAWAMDGFQNIVMRGMGMESVLLPGAVLLSFAGALFGIAAWQFKTE